MQEGSGGIDMYIDGDWVKARGTTLGADNGIGVASIMAILASDEIAHPAIEALFTVDEETGMTGAKGLNLAIADARVLSRALIAHYREGYDRFLDAYSETVLARVWKVER